MGLRFAGRIARTKGESLRALPLFFARTIFFGADNTAELQQWPMEAGDLMIISLNEDCYPYLVFTSVSQSHM